MERQYDEADGYEAFALVYDEALGKPFFSSMSRRLDDLARRFPVERARHLDVACGTGLVLEWSAAQGWSPVGVDASLSMLEIAVDRGDMVLCGDMRSLPFSEAGFDRITCMYDSLNHLLSMDDLVAALSSVRANLSRHGMFWFDVNHPDAYPSVWADDEPFESLGEDWELSIATSYDAGRRVATARITGYATVGDVRVVIDEIHTQRPWTDAEIRRALRSAGLQTAWRTRFEPFGRGGDRDGLKVLYAVEIAGGRG